MKKTLLMVLSTLMTGIAIGQVTNGLIAKYPFTGGNANDQAGIHNGNLFGATPTTDRFGNDSAAFYFNNDSSQYIEVPYSSDFTPGTNPMTISVWFLSSVVDSSDEYIMSWFRCGANPSCSTADAGAYSIALLDTSRLYFDIRDDNLVDSFYTSSQSVSDGNWHHVVLMFDPANNFQKYYLDNILLDSVAVNISSISDGGIQVPLEIGRVFRTGWGSPSSYFNGKIDDIRIYNRILSALEVDSLFNESNTTGISSAVSDTYFSVFPNPSNSVLNIQNSSNQLLQFTLYNSIGNAILIRRITDKESVIDLSYFANGIYFYKLNSANRIIKTGKIIRQ